MSTVFIPNLVINYIDIGLLAKTSVVLEQPKTTSHPFFLYHIASETTLVSKRGEQSRNILTYSSECFLAHKSYRWL